ncbi:MAG: BatA domain-containing protein [Planctomycetaceae bacterium]|nr:BatA domain-containing protein [Planctomycetaceae bacterium]
MLANLPPLLAFGFASPLLAWGALLGAIPIVLHLLHKRRHRETTWAAMRFLLAAIQRNQRRIRLEQLLLLAVRVLILSLLALALAQPFAESFGKYYQAALPTHRIIVLDVSFSMGTTGSDGTRFERAKALARQIVEQSRQGDALNVLRICQSHPRTIVGQPAFQRQPVLSELEQLVLTDEPGELLSTLKELGDVLKRAPEVPRKEIIFVSDFQSATWGEAGGRGALRGELKRLSESAGIVLLDVGDEPDVNQAVVELSIAEPFVAVGKPMTLQATLRNFGPAAQPGQLVELYVDERVAETRKVDLPAGGPVRADFEYTFQSPGEHDIEVRLATDRLPIDNRRWLSVPVRDEAKVLLINGRPAGKPSERATWYLEKALSPSTDRQKWQGSIEARAINEGELSATDLAKYDAVFLCDMRLITDREANVLRTFVASGGGLVIFPAAQSQLDNYNQQLGPEGVDLLPGKLAGLANDVRSSDATFDFDMSDLSHPILRPFEGNPGTGLDSTLTFQYVKVVVPRDGTVRTALSYATGDPAIIERPIGRGRVVLFTTSPDVTWSTWAIQRSFPPIIHETVQHAIAGRWAERRRLVGESITRLIPQAPTGLTVTVKGPEGRSRLATLTEEKNLTTITFDATDRAGLYDMTTSAPLTLAETYAVNVDPRESDPARMSPGELREDLLAGVDFEHRTDWEDTGADGAVGSPSQRGGITRSLLLICLGLLFIEPLLAWNFAIGAGVLVLAIGVLAARGALSWSPLGGGILLAILLLTIAAGFVRQRRPANPARI